jgi:cytochrome P450
MSPEGFREGKTAPTAYSNVKIVTREFKADPFPFYAYLRAEKPVCCVTLPDGQSAWLIARYDDVLSVLRDARFAKDRNNVINVEQYGKQPWVPSFAKPLTRNMLDLDDPDHARLRTLVQKAFTPGTVEELGGRIHEICERLLDGLGRRHRADLVQAYALQVPLTVIVELLGIPGRDRERFHRWSKAIVQAPTPFNMIRAIPSLMWFMRYLRQLFRELRKEPQQGLLTALVQVEEAGDGLFALDRWSRDDGQSHRLGDTCITSAS